MTAADVTTFPFDLPPFALLAPADQARLRDAAVAEHWPAGRADAMPQGALLVVAAGHLQRTRGQHVVALHRAGDLVDLHEALAGTAPEAATSRLQALDDVLAWRVPVALLRALMAADTAFAARLYADLARRLSAPDDRGGQRQMMSLMMVRVGDAYLRKPLEVDGGRDIVSVCRELARQGMTHALVRDGERLGMFTTTDLRDALLKDEPPASLAVRECARFDLIGVHADAELFEALLLMIRHRVHRLVVRDDDGVRGVLSQLDLMSFVSNHSHLVALQIDQATGTDELKAAAGLVDGLIALLHEGGMRIERIAGLVRELNAQLFAKLWALIAPPELLAHSCLLVMGSEGRGEQILKTDQDNALLLRDGVDLPGVEAVAARFNQALVDFGWPPCPGGIMLTNPLWRQPLSAFRETLRQWVYGHDADGPMHLAIFFDATAVAGDAALLAEARGHLERILADHAGFLARFASAADQFQEPGSWWTRLTTRRDEQPLDLKKLGTFPIVHGVRALALEHRLQATGTEARLRALVDGGHLDATLARDLVDALHFVMALKLTHQLRQRALGRPAGNLVRPSELGVLEREPLQDALAIVRRFRQHLRHHFRLDAL